MAETNTKDSEGIAEVDPFEADAAWRRGAISGFVAALAMGLFMSATQLDLLREVIPGLYGLEGELVVGWVVHLLHGALFGIAFAFVMTEPVVVETVNRPRQIAVVGVAYGLALAVVAAGFVMPLWLSVVGFADPPSLPNVSVVMLAWHAVYGLLLGGAFASLSE